MGYPDLASNPPTSAYASLSSAATPAWHGQAVYSRVKMLPCCFG
jgi:hypothetical protein